MKHRSVFTYIGLLFLTAALLFSGYNLITDFYYGKKANEHVEEIINVIHSEENEIKKEEELVGENLKTYEIDGTCYVGIIEMPTIGISLPVIGDITGNNLDVAPCVYVGTPYEPNFVIAAHNRITFFRNIRNLNIGDKVYFMDVYGNAFEYEVKVKDILQADQISEMIDSGYDLSLFTCTFDDVARTTVRLNRTSN